jgi:MFS family permease
MSLLHSLYGWGVVSVVVISSLYFLLFGTQNWFYLTLFWAVLPLIAAFLFWISPIPEMDIASTEKSNASKVKVKGLALCALCIFLGSSAENLMTNWISSYMEIGLQIPKEVGDVLGLAVFALLLALTRMLYAKFTPDISKTLLASMIGAVACYLIAGLSPSTILAFIACICMGVFTSMLWPGTLILMEEKIPHPGVAAYALMAAFGDGGASVAPQLMGIVVDQVSVSRFAAELSQTLGMSAEEIGLKAGMLVASLFPLMGVILVLYIRRVYTQKKG